MFLCGRIPGAPTVGCGRRGLSAGAYAAPPPRSPGSLDPLRELSRHHILMHIPPWGSPSLPRHWQGETRPALFSVSQQILHWPLLLPTSLAGDMLALAMQDWVYEVPKTTGCDSEVLESSKATFLLHLLVYPQAIECCLVQSVRYEIACRYLSLSRRPAT